MTEVKCAHDEMVPVEKLVPNPRNPNKHPAKQIELLAKIIGAQGWRAPITVSTRSGFIVRGHGRYDAAGKLGCESVPVDFQDYGNEAEEWADLIADNRIAELASIDEDELTGILQEMHQNFKDFDLTLTGVEDIAARLAGADGAGDAPEPQIDRAEELQKEWNTATGQVWSIGKHRVMCGDATKKGDVDRLMGGVDPVLMVTDPPYGVEYDPAWRNDAAEKGLIFYAASSIGKVKNDDRVDWSDAYKLSGAQVAYVWHDGRHAKEVQGSMEAADFVIVCQIIWAKPTFAISRGDYHWQHEPCWYAVKKGETHNWQGSRSESTLWSISRGCKDKTGHGTEKPIECMARPIQNNTQTGDAVYDCFLGSGTTMVAAEQTGRICYGMEIDPKYVAVTLERMKDMGLKPELTEA